MQCSNCADLQLSLVIAVQPSDKILMSGLPSHITGSVKKTKNNQVKSV